MGVTFHDESNDSNYSIIGYSDATVHALIVRSKASLGSSREIVQGCGVNFANCLYLVPLIIGQNFCATHATINQTGPLCHTT